MDKYEISIWEDYPDIIEYEEEGETVTKQILRERKIAVIGSDTMTAQARALEPNLVEEINGTHTFTFKMYYTYVDNETGERYENPFGKYLINERKVKVFWKNEWYDLVIKKCQEDTFKKSITYTCTDLFINELSKQGYSLEFDTELQNNIGTVRELATAVLEGSTWQYDTTANDKIIQRTEGPVYEVTTLNEVTAIKQSPIRDITTTIPSNKKVLIFYDSIINILETGGTIPTQFLYAEEGYETDINDSLVINGDCYQATIAWTRNGDILEGIGRGPAFNINLAEGISENYRAKRLVRSQKSEYDPLLDRYVLLCKDNDGNEYYEIATTEYTNPLAIVNLVANPTEFTSVSGWIGQVGEFGVFPKFGTETDISTYSAKSYLKLKSGSTYNTGIQSNLAQFQPTDSEIKNGIIGGIQKGEYYVFRVKAKTNTAEGVPGDYLIDTDIGRITANLYKYKEDYTKNGSPLFTQKEAELVDGWIEYTLECTTAISAAGINTYGLFIDCSNNYWIEDIQFFKYAKGVTSYEEDAKRKRMNPGEISLQSVVIPVYKYYFKNNNAEKADQLTYIYTGEEESPNYSPVYNNYEKIATINEKESNRFNILQSIAESFQAWVKFRIEHEENGAIKIVDGVPQKFVYFVEEIGEETGISFEYGIDLKTISRDINSDKLATKVIVKANNNEFADQGFCSIARSQWNYSKENFILNLDYYTQQNLLDKVTLEKDLYSTQDGYIGYYYNLHKYNTEYDSLTDELVVKNLDYTRQTAQKEVYEQYLLAARQQLEIIESDLINLAGVSQWADAQAYARAHASNEKVQALLNGHEEVKNQIKKYEDYLKDITKSLNTLTDFIEGAKSTQKNLLKLITEKHKEFNDKYSAYIMEGTWQDEDYISDNEYYLDGLNVAYTSSRPQLSYNINVMRLSSLEEYSSKVFHLGDICYMQDREFFGYLSDKITPYKEKILVSKISSFFDQPEKDILTIQNYKTRFDDLFQRIAATTQSLQYQESSFARAAGVINPDKTLSFAALQDTFDQNYDLILNSSNQDITWDDTGITVTNKFNSADKTKIIAGGIFVTNDGGETWKNAVRGDGISTDLLTAGRVNTSEIYIYDGNAPSFRWDSNGITAYAPRTPDGDNPSSYDFSKFVRHDKYGIYGYDGVTDFIPASEDDIWTNSKFGLTWKGFFLKSGSDGTSFEISTDNDLVIKKGDIYRVQIGRIAKDDEETKSPGYGIRLKDSNKNTIFSVDENGANIAGWTMNNEAIYKKIGESHNNKIGFFSKGTTAEIKNGLDKDKNQIYKTINDAYIVAGNNFAVSKSGYLYASGGTIGGWVIEEGMLSSSQGSAYTRIKSNGTIEGQTSDKNKWSIDRNGHFSFYDTSGNSNSSVIQLGDTTINNTSLTTNSLHAGGGSIGGCGIVNGQLQVGSANITSLDISKLSAGGTTMSPSWSSITYVSGLSHLKLSYTPAGSYLLPISIDGEGRITSYTSQVAICHGWSSSAYYDTGTVTVLRGKQINSGTGNV